MGDAVIVSACRTAIGTARKGSLLDVSAFDLAKYAVAESLKRSNVPAADVDDIVLGESLQGGGDIARYAAITSGLTDVPGMVHNRHCASGMAAVQTASASIMAGMDTVVIAGGTESISTSPSAMKRVLGTDEMQQWMSPSHPEQPNAPAFDMSITVGWNTAQKANVTREEMDHWACESHNRAVAAIDEGRLEEEIFPIDVQLRDGTTKTFSVDEHPRRGSSMEKLAGLKPLHPEIEDFSITAGNSSGLNDGSAAMVIVDSEYAQEHGLEPLAIVRGWASAGLPPQDTGFGPTRAIPKALKRVGLSIDDIALFEINEAFASMCVASTRILGIPHEITNVNGSGCSLGHPVACTGARMIVTLIHELRRRNGGYGVASMCAGGGMGSATVIEVLKP
ncbi:MAG TPA: thiolase family protein [Acidimicrobiia bacterium]|jgi:acetyl-CoA C-acetyltransferase|nr:thiolase family protein [Acidimicrobiia bacterium]